MFKLRYSWRLFFAFFPEILCFALKKLAPPLSNYHQWKATLCTFWTKFSFHQEFKVLQEFDFFWVWSLSCHITFFEKRLSKIYSLTVIFGHMMAFNIFYHTLVVRQSLHLLEYFTLQKCNLPCQWILWCCHESYIQEILTRCHRIILVCVFVISSTFHAFPINPRKDVKFSINL